MSNNIKDRKHNRLKLGSYIADITCGCYNFDAIVEDVSFDGLSLSDLSNKFVVKNTMYDLTISGGIDAVTYNLKVQSRWTKKNGNFIDAGFKVIRAPSIWKKFVRQVNSNSNNYYNANENREQYS